MSDEIKGLSFSPTIGKLAEALAKAQGIIKPAKKDSVNPFFKSHYADLESVWAACRNELTSNGIAVVQGGEVVINGVISVTTVLIHTSGEWIKATYSATPVKPDPQGVGSCITYLRRYGLQSLIGIPATDDDGNDASGKTKSDNGKKLSAKPPTHNDGAKPNPAMDRNKSDSQGRPLMSKEAIKAMKVLDARFSIVKPETGFHYSKETLMDSVWAVLKHWPEGAEDMVRLDNELDDNSAMAFDANE